MARNRQQIVAKMVEHPLEDVLDIEPGTTIVEYHETLPPVPATEHYKYDVKDKEIETQFEEIYNTAMDQADIMLEEMRNIDGKYKARAGEVAANMLNVALGAAKEKSTMKQHKDKIAVDAASANTPGTVNNNLIVTDRNEILRMLQQQKGKKEEPTQE